MSPAGRSERRLYGLDIGAFGLDPGVRKEGRISGNHPGVSSWGVRREAERSGVKRHDVSFRSGLVLPPNVIPPFVTSQRRRWSLRRSTIFLNTPWNPADEY